MAKSLVSCFFDSRCSLCSAATCADSVALPAFARRAARLLCAVQQSTDIFGRPRHSSGQTNRQTDGRTPDRCIDPAPHTSQCRNVAEKIKAFKKQ